MRKIFQFLFKLTCVLFLLSGFLLVIGQIIGLLILDGNLIIMSADIFGKPTFIMSALAGLFGFTLNYLPAQSVNTEYKVSNKTIKTY